ncbi:hypothetical protein TNCV_1276431 [Trichonephila clavipes]|nr:hypothetical protein TNCV_1276431 [Trichonephila clavipes]
MAEHLVMKLKTSPNHIGLGLALETGGWQFIDQTNIRLAVGLWWMIPARTRPCRAAYSNASGLSGSVTGTTVVERCSGKASIGSMTNEKYLKHLSLLYVSNRMRFNKDCKRKPWLLEMRPSQYNHGWTITMDERTKLECGKILG